MSKTKTEVLKFIRDNVIERTRGDGSVYVGTADNVPDWVRDIMHDLHDTMLPDDTKYKMIDECLDKLADYEEDNWSESVGEMADSLVDIYNMDRLRWVSSHLYRAGYCDRAVSDGLFVYDGDSKGLFDLLGAGQFIEYEEIINGLLVAIEGRTEGWDDEAEENE